MTHVEEFFNRYHSKKDGRFTSKSGGVSTTKCFGDKCKEKLGLLTKDDRAKVEMRLARHYARIEAATKKAAAEEKSKLKRGGHMTVYPAFATHAHEFALRVGL